MLLLKILRLLLLLIPTYGSTSPVLLWNLKNRKLPTLPTMITVTELQFKEILRPLLANNMIVTFVEPQLSTLDFISHNGTSKTTNEPSFNYLRELINKTYYARVENPMDSLLSISDDQSQYQMVNGTNNTLDCLLGKTAFIFLSSDDLFLSENRHQLLKQHDNEIRQIVSQHLYCPIVYLYLTDSQHSSIEKKRQKRELMALHDADEGIGRYPVHVDNNITHFNVPGRVLIAWNSLALISAGGSQEIKFETIDFLEVFPKNYTVEIQGNELGDISFVIKLIRGYFVLTNLQYDNVKMVSKTIIQAPIAFSYYCRDVTMETKDLNAGNSLKLHFRHFQMQAQFGAVRSFKNAFGPAWHCMGFATAPIAMGIFSTFIVLGIASLGLSLVCSIHTMDKYDTVGQKSIIIEETN